MTNLRQAVILLLLPVVRAAAQNVPAASAPVPYTGFELPDVSGTLRFSINGSERFTLGENGSTSNSASTSISGLMGYLSASPINPFSMVYTGAYIAGGGESTHFISTLALSQVLQEGLWHFVIADSLSYSPENPVTGLTGVPGLGDGNVPPLAGSTTGDEIQTVETTVINNRVSGTASYTLSASTSASATAIQSITRYLNVPGGSSSDENGLTYSGGLNHQIDPYTSVGLRYSYGVYDYLSTDFSVKSQSLTVNASRQLTPNITVNGSIGPQFTSSSNSAIEPSALSYAAYATISYRNSVFNTSLRASRSISAGSGLVAGAESNVIAASVSRTINQLANLSGNVSYNSSTSLQAGADSTQSLVASVQASRAVVAHVSAYGSYTLQRQLNQGSAVPNLALNGITQTLAFGISYSPGSIHIGN